MAFILQPDVDALVRKEQASNSFAVTFAPLAYQNLYTPNPEELYKVTALFTIMSPNLTAFQIKAYYRNSTWASFMETFSPLS